ncbi:Fanconi anemia core complex-associated protein 20 [Kryptolebias marmoratus]|uniref:Fanconi anemia core complex-associated protein 20 n=1 Tax=Kryptolebias marmoratus TaxID=37003 RepID=UPI0007F8F2DE|nr:Fanconi anemia core complex-associated protein 20 [Kryptolebias marmoratus]
MAESYSKSKLKRKKSSAEEFGLEKCSLAAKRSSSTSSSGDGGTQTDRSRPPPAAAPWWRTVEPPAVESLWAFTLMSALKNPQNRLWDPVLDLPLPPAAKPSAPRGDLGWEVDPFPKCSLLCRRTPNPPDRSPDWLAESRLGRRQQLSVQQEEEEEAASSSSPGLKVPADEELQSCPMCLQPFPAGSTQMDRDGHLAQCLSDMDVDMTW